MKVETNILKRNYDEAVSDSLETLWYSTGLTFKFTPKNNTNFFTKDRNTYNMKLYYKRSSYDNASDKNWRASGINGEWRVECSPSIAVETRGRYYLNRYDEESSIRQDADKYNFGVRIEYDFNK